MSEGRQLAAVWEKLSKVLLLTLIILTFSLAAVVAAIDKSYLEAERNRRAIEMLSLRITALNKVLRYPRRAYVGPPDDAGEAAGIEVTAPRYGPDGSLLPRER